MTLGACGAADAEDARDVDTDAAIARLEAALTELPPGTSQLEVGHWKDRRTEILEELREGPPALGAAMMKRWDEATDLSPAVRRGLLDIAAHTDVETTVPRLIEIFDTYGLPLDQRQEAGRLLSELAPKEAVALFEPILREPRATRTWPPRDQLVEHYVRACESTGTDPVPVLVDISSNFLYDDPPRHRAIEELARFPGELTRSTLEAVLVESTGNGYIRRKVVQSMFEVFEPAEYCTIFNRVIEREADPGFQSFLINVVEKKCQ